MANEQVRLLRPPRLPQPKLAEPGADGTVHTHHQGDPQQEANAAHHKAQRLKEEPAGTTDAVKDTTASMTTKTGCYPPAD